MKNNCQICEQEIEDDQLFDNGKLWYINASAIQGYDLNLTGHKRCMENINKLVVIQNRILVDQVAKELFGQGFYE